MSARDTLPALATDCDWLITHEAPPDFFGDVRITLMGAAGTKILLVFTNIGKLAGGYLTERDGKMFHSEKVRDVEVWIANMNGEIA